MTKRLILLIFLLTGCVSYDDFNTNEAAGSFGLAQALEKDERYEESLTQYQDVKNRFPYSKYAVSAELQIAEIQFKKEAFLEAQGAYQLFKELHPKHERIDYVTFQIGESIFMQLPSTIDRDLSLAPSAVKEFDVLIRDYPESKYVKKAQERRSETLGKLGDKELYIADFYFRTSQWLPSVVRYEQFLKEFPIHNKRPYAYYRAGMAAQKSGDDAKRNTLFRQLISEYPESTEAKEAKGVF